MQAICLLGLCVLFGVLIGLELAERRLALAKRRSEWIDRMIERVSFHAKFTGDDGLFHAHCQITREGKSPVYVTFSDKPLDQHLKFGDQ